MKKILIFNIIFTLLFSCNLEDDTPYFRDEILPIESVDIPASFTFGNSYQITVHYLKPSNCHLFNRFYCVEKGNTFIVAILDYKFLKADCEDLEDESVEATFNFQVTNNGSYIFKFWQGEDEDGEDQYLIIEVPVID